MGMDAEFAAVGSALLRRAEAQARARAEIEARWIDDLRQYHGKYTRDVETRLESDQTGSSRIFINETRPKCTALIARLTDMLFPSDDKNWLIQPTAMSNRSIPADAVKAAADGMQKEMDDQLTEAMYNEKARGAIRDAVILGTGILKGPIVLAEEKPSWEMADSEYRKVTMTYYRPDVSVISPWDFFPDMSAASISDAEFTFERRLLSKRALRRLALDQNYRADAIRDILSESPVTYRSHDSTQQERRAIIGSTSDNEDTQYVCWEYHGPLDHKEAAALGVAAEDDDDVLKNIDVVIELIGNRIIRARTREDGGDSLYSVFTLFDDDASIFGYGIPYVIRGGQMVANTIWRMIIDNGAYSLAPQIIMHRELVTPANGVYALQSRKLWFMEDKNRNVNEVFGSFHANNYQQELLGIYQVAKQRIEEESQVPSLLQGELGANPAKTATGMSMLLNSANTVLREIVKRWDDRVTKTILMRLYDWNMAFSDKEWIKGDFEIDARGTSALMVKETQSQALLQLAQLAQQPQFAGLIKFAPLLRKIIETLRLSTDELVKSDGEILLELEKEQAQSASQPQDMAGGQQQGVDYQIALQKIASSERIKAAELADKEKQREADLYVEQLRQAQRQQETTANTYTGGVG